MTDRPPVSGEPSSLRYIDAARTRVHEHCGDCSDWACDGFEARATPPSLPSVDELAQIIRQEDGNHSLGAGELAERIIARLSVTSKEEPTNDGPYRSPLDVTG